MKTLLCFLIVKYVFFNPFILKIKKPFLKTINKLIPSLSNEHIYHPHQGQMNLYHL